MSIKSQLENTEAASVSNACTVKYSKRTKMFDGMLKGGGSRVLFDVAVFNSSGTLVAKFTPTGCSKDKDLSYYIPLEVNRLGGTLSKAGGKLPHFSGQQGAVSVAAWKSDYSTSSLFIVLNDVDPEIEEESAKLLDSVSIYDDDITDEAANLLSDVEATDKEHLAEMKERT